MRPMRADAFSWDRWETSSSDFRPKLLPLKFLEISIIEFGIIDIRRRGREFLAPKNDTVVDVV